MACALVSLEKGMWEAYWATEEVSAGQRRTMIGLGMTGESWRWPNDAGLTRERGRVVVSGGRLSGRDERRPVVGGCEIESLCATTKKRRRLKKNNTI